jgi:hypothetical protein
MLQVLEYKEDLSAYYKHGYGNYLNKDVGCLAVKDFLERFRYDLRDLNPSFSSLML